MPSKKCKGNYCVTTNGGKVIGYYRHREESEQVALQGYSRWRYTWFEGRYCLAKQYTRNN